MSGHPATDHSTRPAARSQARRSAWRRRLVDAERGLAQGMRGDSIFFVHFFAGSAVLAAGFVLGVGPWQWAVILLAWTGVISAELFCQALRTMADALAAAHPDEALRVRRVAVAAVTVTILGALATSGLIFGHRLWQVFLQSQ